jgi:hypothetical protein
MTVNMLLAAVNGPERCAPLTDETLSVREAQALAWFQVARIEPTRPEVLAGQPSPRSSSGRLGEEFVEKSSDTAFEFVTDGSDFLHCLA